MSLQFIMGGAGSGKTRRLYTDLIRQSMEEPEGHFFAIVPEQFTMQTQKEIVELHPCHGVMNIDIVSFERLAYRVFEELSVESLAVLDDMGKSMVLRRVASQVREQLSLFGGHLGKAGFIGELKSMLSEFFQYGITKERLSELLTGESSPLLRQKLSDLLVLYSAFQEYTENRMTVKEEILGLLCRVLPESELIKGSVVTLDGYTGFTPVQYRLLEILLSCCRSVTVTIMIDPRDNPYRESGEQQLFYMSRHTVCSLIDRAARAGTGRGRDILLEEKPFWRFRESPELQFVESELFRYSTKTYVSQEEEQLLLFQAPGPLEEVRFICGEINRLVKQDGLRYRDIAVVTGDLETYGREIVRRFRESGLPFFIDYKKNILGNPLVELIRSALDVFDSGFSYESVFRYLKTGLVLPLSDREADKCSVKPDEEQRELLFEAENYVIALGIRSFRRWNTEWDKTYRGAELVNLERLNRFREEVLSPLIPLREVFSGRQVSVSERTKALVHFLEQLEAEKKLGVYEEYFTASGQEEFAKEYSQVYGLVMEMFDRITALLGDEKVSRKEYAEILDAGFAEIRVGMIPAVVDRIVVGDITRSRLSDVRVLFFAGVNDGVVPAVSGRGGILSEAERRKLKEQRVELAPTAREEGFLQRLFLYRTLTRPSDRLYITCAAASPDGKAMRPSMLIGQLLKLFPGKRLKTIKEEELARWSPSLGMARVLEGLREYREQRTDGEFLTLYRYFMHSEKYRREMLRLTEAAFRVYDEKGIGKRAAKELYGSVLSGSVTRMELYAACAYAHFLTYGLELSERPVFELAPSDIGNLFHAAIDAYFRRMKEEGRSFRSIEDEERERLVAECVADVTENYGNTIMKSSSRNEYLEKKVCRITDRTVWALTEQLRKGDFEPSGFEVSFSASDQLCAMHIPLSGEESVRLRGRIDRIDLCEDGDLMYLKIIDYKTGKTKFDLTDIYYGIQLQLVVYMDAAIEKTKREYPDKRVVPAGLFYYHIEDPMVEAHHGDSEEKTREDILRELRMNGLANSDRQALGHLDFRLAPGEKTADSDVVPAVLKNDEIVERRSSAAGEERFRVLGSYVRRKLSVMGREILDGNIAAEPYKTGKQTACDYCPYHSVCGFDLKTDGYRYRRFERLQPEEIWDRMEKVCENLQEKEKGKEESKDGGKLDPGSESGN